MPSIDSHSQAQSPAPDSFDTDSPAPPSSPTLAQAPTSQRPRSATSSSNGAYSESHGRTNEKGSDFGVAAKSESRDANVIVVDWDGPDDPANPRNWKIQQKWAEALTVSAFTFISPVSSSMVAPAATQIASTFNITDQFQVNLTISIFVLAYAFGPLILGPLCEIFGRSKVLRACNLFFFAWNLACGFAQSEGQLIAFRFLAGIGGSAPLAAGGAVLGDMWPPEERGKSVVIYSLAPLLGPVVGPIAGGWIAKRSTWRWVFWSTSIVAFIVQLVGLWTLKETYAPVLLDRKAKGILAKLDAEGGGSGKEVRTIYQKTAKRDYKQLLFVSICRPFIMSAQEPIIQLLGAYLAFVYGVIYLVLTTIPPIFTEIYHENAGIIGLQYISLGAGLTIASQFNARLLDIVYRRLKAKNGGVGEPEFRLPCIFPGTILLPIGLLIAGWGAQKHTHWIVPDIGFALIGAGIVLTFQGMQMYVIDAFSQYSASALAAVSFLRSIAGFGFPLFAPAMYKKLGYGVGNTILAAIAFAIGCPAIWIFWAYGKKIRGTSKHAK
ncbi:hypothetical protein V8D89_003639 [Ganoderma adspersum]